MKKRRLKIFYVTLCISVWILINGCSNRTKDTLEDLPSPTEIATLADTPQSTSEVLPSVSPEVLPNVSPEVLPSISPEVSPSVSPEVLPSVSPEVSPSISPDGAPYKVNDESDALTQTDGDVKITTSEDIEADKSASAYPQKEFSIYQQNDETAPFNRFYYLDNRDRLNVFFWKYNTDSGLKYTSCRLYKEQKDGTIKDTAITWNRDTDKIINLAEEGNDMVSIMSQWTDENSGDFYIIVSRWSFDTKDNPAFLYGIHPDGKLFVNIQMEDFLVMDKINPNTYACGFTINYIGQDDGIAYFDYKDDSQRAVVYYDMNNACITKQVFTGYSVKGIIDDQYVGVNDQHLIIGSIPKGEKMTNANGNTIVIGQSEIQQEYEMLEYEVISVNGNYVYILTKKNYQRLILGDDNWEILADVSKIIGNIGADLYLDDLMAKDNNIFSLLFYEDCGAGYYIDGYRVE